MDDQDRPLNYYTPLNDIFLRRKLPNIKIPFRIGALGLAARYIPADYVQEIILKHALTRSHKHIASSLYHAAGDVLKKASLFIGDFALGLPSWTGSIVLGILSEKATQQANSLLKESAKLSAPTLMKFAENLGTVLSSIKALSGPTMAISLVGVIYCIVRHAIEPPPYEAPPGVYPNGGPFVEIAQEEAPNKEMVFACPAPLARMVQERVLMCERDPALIQKVKTMAARWCDQLNYNNNQRYAAICGAVAAALTVPVNEQLVLQLAQTHAVQQQHCRINNYLSGIKHRNDPWWTKYMLYRG